MAVNWALGLQQSNPGESFNNAFQQGIELNRERAGRNALATLVQNPSDPKALADLARVNPQEAMQFRTQQAQLSKEEHDRWAKTVGLAAKQATTPEQWDAIVDQFVAAGHPEAAQLKGKFSPAIRHAFMAQGGVQDDNDPGSIREFDEATQRGLLPPGTNYTQFLQMKNPGMMSPVTIPYGATVSPGGGQPAPITATGPNGQRLQLNPQTNQWEPIGGQTPQASGGFRTGPQ